MRSVVKKPKKRFLTVSIVLLTLFLAACGGPNVGAFNEHMSDYSAMCVGFTSSNIDNVVPPAGGPYIKGKVLIVDWNVDKYNIPGVGVGVTEDRSVSYSTLTDKLPDAIKATDPSEVGTEVCILDLTDHTMVTSHAPIPDESLIADITNVTDATKDSGTYAGEKKWEISTNNDPQPNFIKSPESELLAWIKNLPRK